MKTQYITNKMMICSAIIIVLIISSILFFINSVSASFISPIENQTYNTTIINLTFELNETFEDFYYIINNNTDGTERAYPDENLSTIYDAIEGENLVYAIWIINGTEFNESIVFYVNLSYVENSTESKADETTPPVVTQTSSSGGGGGGTCTTKWNCTEWGICFSSGIKYRTCTYPSNYCKPKTDKPNETQSCVYVSPFIEEKNETEVEEITEPVNSIPEYWWIGVIAFMVIFTIILLWTRQKEKQDTFNDLQKIEVEE